MGLVLQKDKKMPLFSCDEEREGRRVRRYDMSDSASAPTKNDTKVYDGHLRVTKYIDNILHLPSECHNSISISGSICPSVLPSDDWLVS